jgi:ankyrin repeat protein
MVLLGGASVLVSDKRRRLHVRLTAPGARSVGPLSTRRSVVRGVVQPATVNILLRAGADVHATNNEGWSAAVFALLGRQSSVILGLLQKHGVDFNKVGATAALPMVMAMTRTHEVNGALAISSLWSRVSHVKFTDEPTRLANLSDVRASMK